MRITRLLKIAMFLLSLFCFAEGYAKELKLSKNIVFVGEVLNKMPSGKGRIMCVDPKDKKNPAVIIEGYFIYGMITDAVLRTKGLDGFAVSGRFNYSVEIDDNKNQFLYVHAVNSSKVNYSHNNINVNNSRPATITINGIAVSFRFDKKSKVWEYQLIDNSDAVQETIAQTIEYPAAICPLELNSFGYSNSNLSEALCPIIISKNGLVQNGDITYKFSNSDEYCNGTLTIHSKGVFNIKSQSAWDGYREFPSAVVRKKSNDLNTISIEYKNGDLFEGVINNGGDIKKILGYNADFANIRPWEGVGKVNGQSEKWIKGETLTHRHNRLSYFLDDDLVLKVEQTSITEEEGKAEMKRREEEKIHQQTLEVMNKYWGDNKTVLFMGKVEFTKKTDDLLGLLFGFDHTFIEGKAVLYLDDSKRGRFMIVTTPTAKAFFYGRAKALQVSAFCRNEFTKKYLGEWEIQDNKIIIDSKECGKISSDGATVTYDGIMTSTLNLTHKTTESSVGHDIPEIDKNFK